MSTQLHHVHALNDKFGYLRTTKVSYKKAILCGSSSIIGGVLRYMPEEGEIKGTQKPDSTFMFLSQCLLIQILVIHDLVLN